MIYQLHRHEAFRQLDMLLKQLMSQPSVFTKLDAPTMGEALPDIFPSLCFTGLQRFRKGNGIIEV